MVSGSVNRSGTGIKSRPSEVEFSEPQVKHEKESSVERQRESFLNLERTGNGEGGKVGGLDQPDQTYVYLAAFDRVMD